MMQPGRLLHRLACAPQYVARRTGNNRLWSARIVERDVVLAFSEGAAVGGASGGLLSSPFAEEEEVIALGEDDDPATAYEPPPGADAAGPAAEATAAYTVRAGDTLYK